MKKRTSFRLVLLALLLITVGLCVPLQTFPRTGILRLGDAVRLDIFAHRIAGADRVAAVWPSSSVRLTFQGSEARQILQAVAAAESARTREGDTATTRQFTHKIVFYTGTNILGQASLSGSLFLLNSHDPIFCDHSGRLDALISQPLTKAFRESWNQTE